MHNITTDPTVTAQIHTLVGKCFSKQVGVIHVLHYTYEYGISDSVTDSTVTAQIHTLVGKCFSKQVRAHSHLAKASVKFSSLFTQMAREPNWKVTSLGVTGKLEIFCLVWLGSFTSSDCICCCVCDMHLTMILFIPSDGRYTWKEIIANVDPRYESAQGPIHSNLLVLDSISSFEKEWQFRFTPNVFVCDTFSFQCFQWYCSHQTMVNNQWVLILLV